MKESRPLRPRTIVTADPELDDLNSMLRFLLYSNEVEVEGLVYASSRFHWKGDGETEFFLPDREYSTPQTSWRWADGERFIDDAIDAYARVHDNLIVHDPRYPSADALRACVRDGNITFEGEMERETPGSLLITDALLDERPGPLHLQVWAGTSTIARALLTIEERYAQSAEWDEIQAAVSRKAIITKFASQDGTYDAYIRPRWPRIRVVDVATKAWGYAARRVVQPHDAHLLQAEWMQRNIRAVGPLGSIYRTWGSGKPMVPGDPTDFFHLSGFTREELTEQGFSAWFEPQPKGEWISEGDSTNMLNLFANGLRGHEHPSFGGWGGRAARVADGPDTWSVAEAVDTATDGSQPPEYSVTRWFADAQHDFAARLRWSVTPEYSDATHHPVITVSPGLNLEVAAGDRVVLRAEVSDPDGGEVRCDWWIYAEAGTCTADVTVEVSDEDEAVVTIPRDCAPGETVHVIAEARSSTEMPLVAYQRVIITVGR